MKVQNRNVYEINLLYKIRQQVIITESQYSMTLFTKINDANRFWYYYITLKKYHRKL